MKENDVAYLSEQYNLTKEIVEASIEDGTLGQRIADAQKDWVIYKTAEDFDSFKTNHKTEIENSYFTDLVDKAKKADIPQELYAPIKGAALQQAERDLGKRLGVEQYTDLNDLVDKALQTSANGDINDELQRQVNELKQRNSELAQEKDDALSTAQSEYNAKLLEKLKTEVLNDVPHDFSNVKSEDKKTHTERTKRVLRNVFDAEYKLGYDDKGREAVFKDNEMLRNPNTYDPVPVLDVFINLAKEIGQKLISPDAGGQGGSSSGKTTSTYASLEEFKAAMESKGIKMTDPRYIEEFNTSGLSNRK